MLLCIMYGCTRNDISEILRKKCTYLINNNKSHPFVFWYHHYNIIFSGYFCL